MSEPPPSLQASVAAPIPNGSDPADIRKWGPLDGLKGFLLAFVAALTLIVIVVGVAAALGVENPDKNRPLTQVTTLVQGMAFVAAALFVANLVRPVKLGQFGLTRFRLSAVGWVFLALFGFLAFVALYAVVVHPCPDDLLEKIGAKKSVELAITAGILIIAVAPFVEEFFFRGFLFQSLNNGIGTWPAALISAAIFGAFHLNLESFLPLTVFGLILAWLLKKTGSLWPSILLHMTYNSIVFTVLMTTTQPSRCG